MRRRNRSLVVGAVLCALSATSLGVTGGASVAVTAETEVARAPVVLRPGSLPRGDDPRIPYLDGNMIIDGDVRVEVPGDHVQLLGTDGVDYLVSVWDTEATSGPEVVRVDSQGTQVNIVTASAAQEVIATRDGQHVVRWRVLRRDGKLTTAVVLDDAAAGERVARREFAGVLDVLDGDAGRLVLGGITPRGRTLWWDAMSNATTKVIGQAGYAADIRADRLATFTRDPYNGGCSVLRSLSDAGSALSRSCRERVAAVAPSGRRVATIHILSDGLGPSEVTVRGDRGRRLARYQVAGWFGAIAWETTRALLLEATGRHKSALVRCELDDCELATDARDAVQP